MEIMDSIPEFEREEEFDEIKCGEIFYNKHGRINYTCLLCTMSASKANVFNEHIYMHLQAIVKVEEATAKNLYDPTNISSSQRHYRDHRIEHEKPIETLKIESVDDLELTNDATCEYCDRKFLCIGLKGWHGSVHGLGGKAYECKFCTASFDTSTEVNSHQLLHTTIGADTLECRHCKQLFRNNNELNKHISYDPYNDNIETILEEEKTIDFLIDDDDERKRDQFLDDDDQVLIQSIQSIDENSLSEDGEEDVQTDEKKETRKRKLPNMYCNKCDRVFAIAYYYNQHMKQHSSIDKEIAHYKNRANLKHINRRIKICSRKLQEEPSEPGELRKYINLRNRKDPSLQCPQCNRMFSVLRYYKEHIKTHKIKRKQILEKISKSKDNTSLLNKIQLLPDLPSFSEDERQENDTRTKQSRSKSPNLYCNKCDSKFSVLSSYREHMKQHSTSKYSANIEISDDERLPEELDKFDNNEIVKLQIEIGEPKSEKYSESIPCSTCDKLFMSQYYYDIHVLTNTHNTRADEQVKQLIELDKSNWYFEEEVSPKVHCDECNLTLSSEPMYKRHMKQHNPNAKVNLFHCDICGLSTKQRNNLVVHMRVHSGEKPYSCPICHQKFNYSSYVRGHIRMMHTGERPYLCTVCGKGFATGGKLNTHMKIHRALSERIKHKCNLCDKEYANRSSLRKHFSIHSELTTISCDMCPRKFRTQKMMLQHKQMHLDTDKYPCQYCDMTFAQAAGLRAHEDRLHRNH